ncbi:toxin C-terminal domain-containing protein [Micromonospora sp. DT233]|uniref:toxin C-terminal domain-containing protein n=1 Tax=Micromonospora sp. DT233 TaxID=3393432 RepID=UPI003CE8D518
MADFPAHLFRMEGDPSAIRSSATRWHTFGTAATQAASQITGLDTSQFVGPEGDLFRQGLNAQMPDHLRITGDAFGKVSTSLTTFGDRLASLQDRMRPLAQRAPGLWAALQGARGRADRAEQADRRHAQEVADRPPKPPDTPTEPDPYRSDSGPAGAALSQAQRDWDECVGQANALRTEQATAVRDCVRVVNEAKGLRFKENPKWWNLKGQFTNFVRDNQELLQKLSGALKIVSLVAGLLSFIPVLAPIMGPIAIAAGAAALLIDASLYAATGKGSLTNLLIDTVLTVVPIGRLAMLGRPVVALAKRGLPALSRGFNRARSAIPSLSRPSVPMNARRCVRDPIDVASGEVVLGQTDAELPGLLPVVLHRNHLSSYRAGRWFGPSWASTLDQRVEIDDEGICFVTEDGMVLTYPSPPAVGVPVLPETGPRWPLTSTADGCRVDQPETGRALHFLQAPEEPEPPAPEEPEPPGQDEPEPQEQGRAGPQDQEQGQDQAESQGRDESVRVLPLGAVTDRNGHRIDLRWRAGDLTEIRHSGGYRIAVDTRHGRVAALSLLAAVPSGEAWTLARFGYDDDGHLAEVTNSSGRPLRFGYDGDGRLTHWRDRNEQEYRYTYDEQGRCVAATGSGGFLAARLQYDPDARRTTVVDSFGHATAYELNERGQTQRVTDPLGNVTASTWDRFDRKLTETDALGRTTRWSYDDDGNLVEITRPDGARATATYDDRRQPVLLTDVDGARWRREYDERGNLTMVTDPTGATTRYRYDDAGRLAEVTDALGNTLRVATDPAGLLSRLTEPTGAVTSYRRDRAGRITELTDPVGGTTRLGWTVEGRLAWRRGPDGVSEEWTYDPEGNLVAHTDQVGATTEFEIGPFDLPVARTGPDGARLTFDYDTELRLTTVTNPHGLTWRYDYDPAGRLVAETDFNGRTRTYAHDAAGQVVARTNGAGQTAELLRDPLGNVVQKRTAEGVTTFGYDPTGRLLHAASPEVDLRFERDPLGRVLAEIRDGRPVTSSYDAIGRRLRRRTPSGVQSDWEYDAGHRPTALRTGGATVSFAHDAAGRETRRAVGGVALTQSWDANDRLLSQTVTASPATGGPAGVPDLLAHRAYRYRADGYLIGVVDQLTGERRLELDRAGRITAVRAADWTERYAYDEAGNLTDSTWPGATDGDADGGGARGGREYTGTLIRRAGDVRYEHDDAGRVVLRQVKQRSTKPLTWRYTWDSEDRLVAVTTPDGTRWRYRYDALGRRVAKQRLDADGGVAEQVDFAWDGPRLIEQTRRGEAGGRTSTWEYAPDTFTPIGQTDAPADQDEVDRRFYAIVTDLVGTPTDLVSPDGEVVWQQRTTIWGIPTHISAAGVDCPLRFPGQIHDPETGASYNYHRYFDPEIGRYFSTDPLGLDAGPNPHAYVSNPSDETDPFGLAPGNCNPITRDQSDDIAKYLGYTKTNKRSAGGAPIWENKKAPSGEPRYITWDRTGHKGGIYKGANFRNPFQSTKDSARDGTYDLNVLPNGDVLGLKWVAK